MTVYLTASMGVGQRLGLDTIDRRLRRYPIGPVLHALGQVAWRIDHLRLGDVAGATALSREILPATVARGAEPWLRRGAMPTSSQVVVNLALRALVVCPTNGAVPAIDKLLPELGLLLLALSDHLGRDRGDPNSMAVEITRLGLFFSNNDLAGWLEIAGPLFFEILPAMTDDADYIDVEGLVQSVYGIGLKRLWAITVVEGVAAREHIKPVNLPIRVPGWSVTEHELASWTRAWASDLASAREKARDDLAHGTSWSFGTLANSPLIAVEPGRLVAVRPAWVAAKATPAGMFWLVRNAFVAQRGDHLQWSRLFGKAVERLGRRLLDEYQPAATKYTEEDIKHWGAAKQCDVIVAGNEVIAIDFVYRQFTAKAAGQGNFSDLENDLRKAAVEKLEQIDVSLAVGIEIGIIPTGNIYPIVVVGGPFPVNPLLHQAVEALVLANSPCVVGQGGRCQPFAMIDLVEFRLLLLAANRLDRTVGGLLSEWLQSGMAKMSFREWVATDGPGDVLANDTDGDFPWGTIARDIIMGGKPQPTTKSLKVGRLFSEYEPEVVGDRSERGLAYPFWIP